MKIRIRDFNTNNKNTQSGYRNGIWNRKIFLAYDEKLKKTNNGRNRTIKSGENQKENIIKQAEMKEKVRKE